MTPGTVIAGRYRIESMLGRGGMGAVYKAMDLNTTRARAIKLMLEHRVQDDGARERFRLEAGFAGRIDSPFVVDVIDAGVASDTGVPYIVMELLDGENLEQRLARLGPRPAAEVVEHLAQVARALQRMHARDIVHRDLKPSNLFLEEHGGAPRIKVLDLGVAKVLSVTASDTTAIVGSVPYMAPEQIRGRAVGPATDLYALGLIAYTLLTGAPYWRQARDEQPIALAMKIAEGTVEPASARARAAGVALAPAFDEWFARATARQPHKRFRSAIEAMRDLAGALGAALPPWDDVDPDPPPPSDVDALDDTARAPVPGLATETASAAQHRLGLAARAEDALRSPPPRRRRAALGLATAGGAAVAGWAIWRVFFEPAPSQQPMAQPPAPVGLARPQSVLACPVLDVNGDVTEWGWLGAAAGSLACERARVVLGGLPSRTSAPAELLDLRDVRGVDDDPYGSGAARERSLAAARRHDAYLDGSVARMGSGKVSAGFRVDLALRLPDGTELKRTTGEGRGLHRAVREAMTALVEPGLIPMAAQPDPVVADYSRASDVATMLHLLDWKLATANNADGVATECAPFATTVAVDDLTDLAPFARYTCAYIHGGTLPDVTAPTAATPGALAARARVEHTVHGKNDPILIEKLNKAYEVEPSSWGKSVIAATLSCLLEASARRDALSWAKRAVDAQPKNPTGEWCAPWGQLMSIADDTPDEAQAVIRWRVWAPWESYAWRYAANNTKDPEHALRYAYRAYALSPLDTGVASELSNHLLRHGQRSDVADIAARFGQSEYPAHKLQSTLLTVRVLASQAQFSQALATTRDAMRPRPDDAGWVLALRLELAWRAVAIANVLDQAKEVAGQAIRELVDPRPFRLDLNSLEQSRQVIAICAYAANADAQRCVARLAAHESVLNPAFAEGARQFAAGKLKAAATAWQPLVRNSSEQVDLLAEAMIRAFSAQGDHELVARITAQNQDSAPLFGGATMAMARAAQAARDRGDRAEAQRLAKLVVDAWVDADTKPPILQAMRQLGR